MSEQKVVVEEPKKPWITSRYTAKIIYRGGLAIFAVAAIWALIFPHSGALTIFALFAGLGYIFSFAGFIYLGKTETWRKAQWQPAQTKVVSVDWSYVSERFEPSAKKVELLLENGHTMSLDRAACEKLTGTAGKISYEFRDIKDRRHFRNITFPAK